MNAPTTIQAADHGVSLREALGVWLRIALLSFGGPAGQIALMHKVLVEEKRWLSETRFLHALNYCMLLPGPEAQQLATYVGWLMHGTLGGVMAGGLFVLPGAAAIMALSVVYALFGKVGFVAAAFFGLKAAVLAIVVQAVIRVGKRALKNHVLQGFAAIAFVAIFFFDAPFPLIVLTAGVVGYVGGRAHLPQFAGGGHGSATDADGDSLLGDTLPGHTRPKAAHMLKVAGVCLLLWLVPVAALLLGLGPANVFSQIAVFFSKMAMVTFGGAYAVLAYVAQQAVDNFHWLRSGEMLDGLGMAETTPGPLVIVLQFVGFLAAYRDPGSLPPLVAGALGGLLTTWVTFVPCFLWIFLGAPFVEKIRGNKALAGALTAITAAVVGVILNLAIWFALHALFRETIPVRGFGLSFEVPALSSVDATALLLAVAAAFALFRLNLGVPRTLAVCTGAGVLLFLIGASPAAAQTLIHRGDRRLHHADASMREEPGKTTSTAMRVKARLCMGTRGRHLSIIQGRLNMTHEFDRRHFIGAAATAGAALAVNTARAEDKAAPTRKSAVHVAAPMPFDPKSVKGLSEKILVSHYENNYGGAVKRLNAIGEQLAGLDFDKAPGFQINGLKREELIATNSMILHEVYFAGLGEANKPGAPLSEAIERDFGSFDRWRSEFAGMGKALGGGSGWVILAYDKHGKRLINSWASDHTQNIAGGDPVLVLDMFEHAYQMDYGAKAGDYVKAVMAAINWSNADRLFAKYGKG